MIGRAYPRKRIGGKLGTLLVAQVHQEPVRKHNVISPLGQVQLARISNLVAHILPAGEHGQ